MSKILRQQVEQLLANNGMFSFKLGGAMLRQDIVFGISGVAQVGAFPCEGKKGQKALM